MTQLQLDREKPFPAPIIFLSHQTPHPRCELGPGTPLTRKVRSARSDQQEHHHFQEEGPRFPRSRHQASRREST